MTSYDTTYHLSISEDALESDPKLLGIVSAAGVTDIWITGFLYGHRHYSFDRIEKHKRLIEDAGMACHVVTVPLGHPGDSLGSVSGDIPLTPPAHWKMAIAHDGCVHSGTSLHSPATEENVQYLSDQAAIGIDKVFLDDDFRLAGAPGSIGGCFCDYHRDDFCHLHGYGNQEWADLKDAIKARELTPILRAWVDYNCDQLTSSFRAQQAASDSELGIMVMYLGAEKAGIRLSDYSGVPFRVGEMMFDDNIFSPVKGKTDELFSSLFHRRFVEPNLAYSETTAYPADKLSARNMAAKLSVPLISDVRNVMYMSGLTAFPREHWSTLGPAMKKNKALHRQIAGHKPSGPFKHYWGEHSRYVGDDNPYSLFLALGVPFEVTDELSGDGWTFLSDADARGLVAGSSNLIARQSTDAGVRTVPETLKDLFSFKHEIMPKLRDVPFVEEDIPIVCAWYPEIRTVLLWNLSERRETLTLSFNDTCRTIVSDGLDVVTIRIE